MSGGSMDYLYLKVEEASFSLNTPERRAFYAHLLKVSQALKAIEWQDSSDGYCGENDLIRECLSNGDVLEQLVNEAKELMNQLNAEIQRLGLHHD